MGKAKVTRLSSYQEKRTINLLPKNEKQDMMIFGMKEKQLVAAIGSAGTGKTYCAAVMACQLLESGYHNKIVLARPNVSTGPSLGAFPGEPEEKLAKWLSEPISIIKETIGVGKYDYLVRKERLILEPLETCRGRSYENAFIIIDEAQNLDTSQLKMMATRIGENSTMVFCGDSTQADKIKGEAKRGEQLHRFFDTLLYGGVDMMKVEFAPEDIVRSGIVRDIVMVCEQHGI